jgi:hypothetical protein
MQAVHKSTTFKAEGGRRRCGTKYWRGVYPDYSRASCNYKCAGVEEARGHKKHAAIAVGFNAKTLTIVC